MLVGGSGREDWVDLGLVGESLPSSRERRLASDKLRRERVRAFLSRMGVFLGADV